MARFAFALLALAAIASVGLSMPLQFLPILPLSPKGKGIVLLPDGTTGLGGFDGSLFGRGSLAAAAADVYSGGAVGVAAGNGVNTAAAIGAPGSGAATATNSRR